MVMSTDPAENASGITLAEWHDSADAFDDDEEEGSGVSLTSYAFMKGHESGKELGITAPGTVMFINSIGEVTKKNTSVYLMTQLKFKNTGMKQAASLDA